MTEEGLTENKNKITRTFMEREVLTHIHRQQNLKIISGLTAIDTIQELVQKGISFNVEEIAEWEDFLSEVKENPLDF